MGAGSICTTRVVAGVGVPQFSAILQCAQGSRLCPSSPTAASATRATSSKPLAAGASFVMLGNLLAGLDECPGETILLEGRRYKQYRGMGSMGAMQGYGARSLRPGLVPAVMGRDSGKLVPEGIEGRVPYKGQRGRPCLPADGRAALRHGLCRRRLPSPTWAKARFVRITNAGYIESHPHSVIITEEAPNYQPQSWNQ